MERTLCSRSPEGNYSITINFNPPVHCSIQAFLIRILLQVSQQVGHSTKAKEDAIYHVERLILQLLGELCSRPTPHSVPEIQDRIQKMFPPPVDKWAMDEATSALNKSGKKKNYELVFPVDKIHSLLQKVSHFSRRYIGFQCNV